MEAAFAWIGYCMEWLGSLIPRLRVVRSTHAGVRFRHGNRVSEVTPGLCVYWPIVTELEVVPVARQTHNLPVQALTTKDGKKVVVSGVVVYSIKNVVDALSKNWDVSDTINDITMVAITQVFVSHDYAYLLTNLTTEVAEELTRVTRKKLSAFGIKVYRTAVTDFSQCLVINNVGGFGTVIAGPQKD